MMDEIKPYPLITEAIRRHDLEALAALFDRFPDAIGMSVPGWGTWLHHAAAHGELAMVRYLIEHGLDPASCANDEGRSALAEAAARGHADIVRHFVDLGVAMDTTSAVTNPLFGAIVARSAEVATLLVDAGIDLEPRYRLGASRETLDALALAMLHGTHDIARMIALNASGGDARAADAAMAEGLRIAEAITRPAEKPGWRRWLFSAR